MIAKIEGHSLLSLYQRNSDLIQTVKQMLESIEFDEFQDIDQREADHPLRRKVMQILSQYEPVSRWEESEQIEGEKKLNLILRQIWLR